MVTINFYRFIPTPKIVKLIKDHSYYNVFSTIFDHKTHDTEKLLPINKARLIASRWLEDHYGYCEICIDNQDEYGNSIKIKICNHKKFIKDMKEHNIKLTIKGLGK